MSVLNLNKNMFSLTINSSTCYMSSMYQIKCVVLLYYSYLMWVEDYTFGNANELIRIHKQNQQGRIFKSRNIDDKI